MVLGGEAFGRWFGYEGGAPMNGISALPKKGLHRAPWLLLSCEDTMRKGPSVPWKRALPGTQLCGHPDLRLPASRSWRNQFLLFTSHPVCGILLQQPQPGWDTFIMSTHNSDCLCWQDNQMIWAGYQTVLLFCMF